MIARIVWNDILIYGENKTLLMWIQSKHKLKLKLKQNWISRQNCSHMRSLITLTLRQCIHSTLNHRRVCAHIHSKYHMLSKNIWHSLRLSSSHSSQSLPNKNYFHLFIVFVLFQRFHSFLSKYWIIQNLLIFISV